MCKYVHECENVSFCEEKYAIIYTNLIVCLLCKVTSQCVSAFASVQDEMWTCKSVCMLIVCLQFSLCTKYWRRARKFHTFSHLYFNSYLMLSFLNSTLIKFSTSRFVYMHIRNVKIPKLSASLIARLLFHLNYWSHLFLWMDLSMILPLVSHSYKVSRFPHINCNLTSDTLWRNCPPLHSTTCLCI